MTRWPGPQQPTALGRALSTAGGRGVDFVRWWHRLEITQDEPIVDEPTMFVGTHGFGTIFDPNVGALIAALRDLHLDRPVVILTHEMAWTLRVGWILETVGAQPADRDVARAALARGEHVLVLPGGDIDGFKPFRERNRIVFGGRTGFAELAIETGVPIVPIVNAGAGNTLYAFPGGDQLARLLCTDRWMRLKRIPISLSVPWGFNVGIVGFVPYLPLPAKFTARILPAHRPHEGENPEEFAGRIQAAMQTALTQLAR